MTVGQTAFEAYRQNMTGTKDSPDIWDHLPAPNKEAWEAAATAILELATSGGIKEEE